MIGALRVDDVFVAQFGEAYERIDGTVRRIARPNRQIHSFAIGFEFFVLVVAGFPEIERNLQQRSQDVEVDIFQLRFHLHALDTVIVVDVLDLVGQDVCEFIFARDQVEHTFSDVDRSSRKRKSVDHVVIGEDGKGVR